MQGCAVLYLVCRGGVLRCGAKRNECPWGTPPAVFVLCFGRGRAPPLRTIPAATVFPNQRPKAATYLCRFAAKARFDNRPNPRRVFPKREGRSPPSLVAQGRGIFKGEGRPKLPSPLNGVLWILSFAKERKYPAGGKKSKERGKPTRAESSTQKSTPPGAFLLCFILNNASPAPPAAA